MVQTPSSHVDIVLLICRLWKCKETCELQALGPSEPAPLLLEVWLGYTPENEHVDAKNYPIEEENHLNQIFMSGFHVSFRGCTRILRQIFVFFWVGGV